VKNEKPNATKNRFCVLQEKNEKNGTYCQLFVVIMKKMMRISVAFA